MNKIYHIGKESSRNRILSQSATFETFVIEVNGT